MPSPESVPASILDPYFAPLHLAFVFIIGACFGSFFNVCIYRMPRELPLSMPPSHCYACGSRVRWFDNIPLVSWWLLGGRCRVCHARFSMRYWWIELLTALLFTGVAVRLGYTLAVIPALIFVSFLIIGTFTDIDHWIIPDRISLGGLACGLVLAAIWPIGNAPGNPVAVSLIDAGLRWTPLANSVTGAAVGFGGLWAVGVLGTVIFRKDAMGFGDVKLFGMLGAFCGLTPLLHLLLVACVIGTVVGLTGKLIGSVLRSMRPIPEAIAPLEMSEEARVELIAKYPLDRREEEIVAAALKKPGSVGPVRHHLPFGPSLAAAGVIIYLYHAEIAAVFERIVMRLSGGRV